MAPVRNHPFSKRLVGHTQVHNRFAHAVVHRPGVSGLVVIAKYHPVLVEKSFPVCGLPPFCPSQDPVLTVGVKDSREYRTASPLPNNSLLVQSPLRSLCSLPSSPIMDVDNPCHRLSPSCDVDLTYIADCIVAPLSWSLIAKPLPWRITVLTVFLFLISYARRLIPTPALSVGTPCIHTMPASVRLRFRVRPWSIRTNWRCCAGLLQTLTAGAPVSTEGSMLVIVIRIVAIVVAIVLSAMLISSSIASSTLASAISSSHRPVSPPPRASARWPFVII